MKIINWMLLSKELGHSLFEVLRRTEPQRARALYQALQRIELIRAETVITMMPFDLVFP